ncbi:MAG: DUF1684 domain-containing protein, partial [Chloroflexi bacterium]
MGTPSDPFTLAHWRRSVAELYAHVRLVAETEPQVAWQYFRATRDHLFRTHPQTPLSPEQIAAFVRLPYYAYDPSWRIVAQLDRDVPRETFRLELPADGTFAYTRVAVARFEVDGQPASLSVFWIEGYGGGLFLPFRDASSGQGTYGGGR